MSSTLGINQMNQLANKLSKMGWDESRVTSLGQANAMKFKAIEEILDGKSLEDAIRAALAARDVDNDTTHLRFLQSVSISPTVGTTTLAQGSDVFAGFLDPDFKKWGTDMAGIDTDTMSADIYETKKDGTYAQLFGSVIGASGSHEEITVACRSLCWQQGQIVMFIQTHLALLRNDGYSTFFLFEVNGVMFVARVYSYGPKPEIYVDHFSRPSGWCGDLRQRVVVPQ